MNKLERDYSGDYVIISPHRKKRPIEGEKKICHFCPENEKETGKSTQELKNEKGEWLIRSVKNKYSLALENEVHEVIIETRKHKLFRDFDETEIKQCYDFYQERIKQLKEKYEYLYLFKNEGPTAGASLKHAHSQIISFPKKIIKKNETAINGDTLKDNKETQTIIPTNTKHSYEIIIKCKRENSEIANLTEEEKTEISSELKKIIGKVNYDYNILHHDHPYHAHVIFRKNVWAGIELGLHIYVKETTINELRGIFK